MKIDIPEMIKDLIKNNFCVVDIEDYVDQFSFRIAFEYDPNSMGECWFSKYVDVDVNGLIIVMNFDRAVSFTKGSLSVDLKEPSSVSEILKFIKHGIEDRRRVFPRRKLE